MPRISTQRSSTARLPLLTLGLLALNAPVLAQTAIPAITIKGDQVSAHVSPMLYGLMTEEINYSYEGGLYGELLRNRSFKGGHGAPSLAYWTAIGGGVMTADTTIPLNDA